MHKQRRWKTKLDEVIDNLYEEKIELERQEEEIYYQIEQIKKIDDEQYENWSDISKSISNEIDELEFDDTQMLYILEDREENAFKTRRDIEYSLENAIEALRHKVRRVQEDINENKKKIAMSLEEKEKNYAGK